MVTIREECAMNLMQLVEWAALSVCWFVCLVIVAKLTSEPFATVVLHSLLVVIYYEWIYRESSGAW